MKPEMLFISGYYCMPVVEARKDTFDKYSEFFYMSLLSLRHMCNCITFDLYLLLSQVGIAERVIRNKLE